MTRILFFSFISLSVLGCRTLDSFANLNRSHWKINKQYNSYDTLFITDYVLCSNIRKLTFNPENQPHFIDEDSVFKEIKASLNKLELHFNFSAGAKNQCDSSFQANYLLRSKKIDHEKLQRIGFESGSVTLVPVVYIDNVANVGLYMTSTGGSGGDFYVVSHFLILVNIYKDGNLIYRKNVSYISKKTVVRNFEEAYQVPSAVNVRQEHLDELVRLAMKDYIKRLK